MESLPAGTQTIINTLNLYSWCIAENDFEFKQALIQSDVLLPDGIAVVGAVRFLSGNKISKIAGADLHLHLLNKLDKAAGRCFYMGASENSLSKIKQKLSVEFPAVEAAFYSPPFKAHFSAAETAGMIKAINKFRPDILFVGMTAPKQEKWIFKNKTLLFAGTICNIGAALDFYAGTIKRPGNFWIYLGLEWLVRLSKEPRRLWKRYLYHGPHFIWTMIKEKQNLRRKARDEQVW